MRRLSVVALMLIAIVLAGCDTPGSGGGKAEPTSLNVPTSADISSGCWKAEQRALPVKVGDRSVAQWKQPPAMAIDTNKTYVATIEVDKFGSFEITFFPKDAPNTVNNFVCLARAGFYDNTTFHRIVKGFVIQGGDPEGTGGGGPGYRFNDEPVTRDYSRGIVAMANAGANTNGSQFFVCLQNVGLPKNYTIFGEVTAGMDVVDKIAAVETKANRSGEQSTPVQTIKVTKVTISET
jgi:cyclophilin family peptidyl-prolyl cis-trans isomerase